jgi:methyl-accepting chemotaxis protein
LQRVTSQNSALVQQGASIAETLSEQAQQLVALVERFQLEGGAALAGDGATQALRADDAGGADRPSVPTAYPALRR